MNKYLQQIKADIDLPLIKKSIIFAVLFGFIVHGSNFFNPVYCHDSLQYYYQDTDVFWKISIGRFMQAITIPLRGYDNIPLINGTLSLIFVGLSSYVIAKTLYIKNRINIYLISALIITSISYITTNVLFFHELDPFMLSVLFASVGVYIFNKFRYGYIVASVPFALCCGLYQPYMSVAIMLLMISIIREILDGRHSSEIIKKSLKVIITLALAGFAYFFLYKLVAFLANINIANSHNNVELVFRFNYNSIGSTLFVTYWNVIKYYLFPYAGNLYISSFVVSVSIAIYALILGVYKIKHSNISAINLSLLLIILFLMPLAINIATFLSSGVFHEAMIFSVVFIYVLFLILIEVSIKCKSFRFIAYALLFVVTFNGATFANRVYVERSIFFKETHSMSFNIYKDLVSNFMFVKNNNIPIQIIGNNHAEFNLQMQLN
ncbi:MAG: glucosyltransferase domain-containing protein [Rikenellaceae bacterium]